MRNLIILLALLGLAVSAQAASPTHGSVGAGRGITLPHERSNPCPGSTFYLNYDGSAENGFCWQYGGIVPPYYGAFAECYHTDQRLSVCGIELMLTTIPNNPCRPCDLYVWDDNGGQPGNVLSVTTDANPCPVAFWPEVSTHDFAVNYTQVSGAFWVGYWGSNFGTGSCDYFIAADVDGPGGCPMTNIAPGIGYPTGWQNVSIVWGPTAALGIGAFAGWGPCCGPDQGPCCFPDRTCQWVESCPGYWSPSGTCDPNPCQPVPVKGTSWGQIKALYK